MAKDLEIIKRLEEITGEKLRKLNTNEISGFKNYFVIDVYRFFRLSLFF